MIHRCRRGADARQLDAVLTPADDDRRANSFAGVSAMALGTFLAEVRHKQPLSLATFRRWRSSLHTASSGFDKVVGAHVVDLTGNHWD